jgi:uncharacterized protein (TIGR02646 family)
LEVNVIRRERPSVIPKALDGKQSRGGKELVRAVKHYEPARDTVPSHGTFTFKAYSDASVKSALTALFQGKCAYCEALYASTQPMDVEHFRPKSEILLDDGQILRGYWWLAASWTNLLPSCIDCNRERGQDELFTDGSRRAAKSGKQSRFPVEDETQRVRDRTSPLRIDDERPLLLDPCEIGIDPADHLEFMADGLARARTERGRRSIEIYGLNRTELVRARKQVALFVRHRLNVLDALVQLLDPALGLSSGARDIVTDLIDYELEALRELGDDDQPFAQMVRQITREALARRYSQ